MRGLFLRRAGNHRMRARDVRGGRPPRASPAAFRTAVYLASAQAHPSAHSQRFTQLQPGPQRHGSAAAHPQDFFSQRQSFRDGMEPLLGMCSGHRCPPSALSTHRRPCITPPLASARWPGHRPAPRPGWARRRVEPLGIIGKPRLDVAGEREDREEEGGTEGHAHRPPQTRQRARPYAAGWSQCRPPVRKR